MAIDLDALRAQYETLVSKDSDSESNSKLPYITLKDGNNVIRILPGNDEVPFYAETAIHRIPQDGQTYDRSVHCLKMHGDNCPLCDLYYALWDGVNNETSEDPAKDKKLANKIRARSRYYFNAIDRGDEDKVKVFSVGIKLYKTVIGSLLDEDYITEDEENLADLQNGHDYKIHKVMEDGWPKYDGSMPRPKVTPAMATKKGISEVMDSLHDIKALVKEEDYAEVKLMAESVAVTGRVAAMGKSTSTEDKPSKAEPEKEVSSEEYEAKLKGAE
tara:strand:+ start:2502 stop:3320 length:819 start_codon:yes stop_codon:yes gene_type:complete